MQGPHQPAGHLIDIGGWREDEDNPTYPIGSKPKKLLWSPSSGNEPFIRPQHRYLFKEGVGRHANQVWSEAIAYEIARLVDAPVPPAFIAIDGNTGQVGALVEFFLGFEDEPPGTRLVPAADFMQGLVDQKRGRPHGVYDNLALSAVLRARGRREWWAEALAFDAMIGNRDRHPENWGFLVHRENGHDVRRLAPLYDNGVSLGYEQLEERLTPPWTEAKVKAYVAKGVHHCGWSNAQDKSAQHAALCGQFVRTYPSTRPIMERVASASDSDVEAVLEWATSFEGPLRFSRERAVFVAMLTKARREALVAAIKEQDG